MQIRTTISILAVLAAASFPAAGHGQRQHTPRQLLAERAVGEAQPSSSRTAPPFTIPVALSGASAEHFANPTRASARQSRWRAGLLGAGIGSGIGIVAFLVTSDGCWRKPESMCELSIPLYVGAGAATGGVVGLILGR